MLRTHFEDEEDPARTGLAKGGMGAGLNPGADWRLFTPDAAELDELLDAFGTMGGLQEHVELDDDELISLLP